MEHLHGIIFQLTNICQHSLHYNINTQKQISVSILFITTQTHKNKHLSASSLLQHKHTKTNICQHPLHYNTNTQKQISVSILFITTQTHKNKYLSAFSLLQHKHTKNKYLSAFSLLQHKHTKTRKPYENLY